MNYYNCPIPKDKMTQFHEILCATGGRYIEDPQFVKHENQYRVSYTPGKETEKLWHRCLTEIKEVRKDQKWRIFLRRFLHINA